MFQKSWEKKNRHPHHKSCGQLSDLMLGRVTFPNYLDPGSPIVDVHIDGIIVPNTLINLGAAINVVTNETMLKLNVKGALRKITTVL